MSDLVEFLRARLDEDEQEAREVLEVTAPMSEFALTYGLAAFFGGGSSTFPSRHWSWDPARVLAEVATKRKILELHAPQGTSLVSVDGEDVEPDSFEEIVSRDVVCMACAGYPTAPCRTVLAMVQVYAGHPQFDPAWKGGASDPAPERTAP